jgi:DNA-directed RNA polymerase subunit beta
VGELIQNQVRIGLSRMERVVRERMTTAGRRGHHPADPDQHPPGVAAIKEFFGTSQLSQFMDQNNPLSG